MRETIPFKNDEKVKLLGSLDTPWRYLRAAETAEFELEEAGEDELAAWSDAEEAISAAEEGDDTRRRPPMSPQTPPPPPPPPVTLTPPLTTTFTTRD